MKQRLTAITINGRTVFAMLRVGADNRPAKLSQECIARIWGIQRGECICIGGGGLRRFS